jgi:hypothetical protein
MQKVEEIGALIAKIGRQLGKPFALDSRGTLSLSYDGGRSCVFAAQGGFRPRIGMQASLIPAATDDQFARALLMNAKLDRRTGVLALDSVGALVFTAAADAENITEDELAGFMGDFMKVSIELTEALRAPGAAPAAEAFASDSVIIR